mmetsp:Transcript_13465/g.40619  ORF Transcript_13465/g.40619 Transcript_13465/m.40619 type:complete len:270 (-) Transcript_13465:2236-3045(-)
MWWTASSQARACSTCTSGSSSRASHSPGKEWTPATTPPRQAGAMPPRGPLCATTAAVRPRQNRVSWAWRGRRSREAAGSLGQRPAPVWAAAPHRAQWAVVTRARGSPPPRTGGATRRATRTRTTRAPSASAARAWSRPCRAPTASSRCPEAEEGLRAGPRPHGLPPSWPRAPRRRRVRGATGSSSAARRASGERVMRCASRRWSRRRCGTRFAEKCWRSRSRASAPVCAGRKKWSRRRAVRGSTSPWTRRSSSPSWASRGGARAMGTAA